MPHKRTFTACRSSVRGGAARRLLPSVVAHVSPSRRHATIAAIVHRPRHAFRR